VGGGFRWVGDEHHAIFVRPVSKLGQGSNGQILWFFPKIRAIFARFRRYNWRFVGGEEFFPVFKRGQTASRRERCCARQEGAGSRESGPPGWVAERSPAGARPWRRHAGLGPALEP
jgi:hypothetical protein